MEDEEKTLQERFDEMGWDTNDVSSYCPICKDCKYRSDGTKYTVDYRNSFCAVYQYPFMKPYEVVHDGAKCRHYKVEGK